MLKKLMSIAVIGMLMVGCGNTTQPTQPTKNVQEQPKQVNIQQQEENTPQDVQEPVKDNKEQTKEEVPNGLVKDGTHLQEEADKQDKGYTYDPDLDTTDQEYWDSFSNEGDPGEDAGEYCSDCGEWYYYNEGHTCPVDVNCKSVTPEGSCTEGDGFESNEEWYEYTESFEEQD